ncbi:hypothetical protein ACFQ87_42430, partial [Kitasatospora sp. NPDC056531]
MTDDTVTGTPSAPDAPEPASPAASPVPGRQPSAERTIAEQPFGQPFAEPAQERQPDAPRPGSRRLLRA